MGQVPVLCLQHLPVAHKPQIFPCWIPARFNLMSPLENTETLPASQHFPTYSRPVAFLPVLLVTYTPCDRPTCIGINPVRAAFSAPVEDGKLSGKPRLLCPVWFLQAHPCSSRLQPSPGSQTCPSCSPHLRRILSHLCASRGESLLQEAFAVCSWSVIGEWGSYEPRHHSILMLLAGSRPWGLLFTCNFLCNASEGTAKSFSDSNNVSLQSSRVFPPHPCEVTLQVC